MTNSPFLIAWMASGTESKVNGDGGTVDAEGSKVGADMVIRGFSTV